MCLFEFKNTVNYQQMLKIKFRIGNNYTYFANYYKNHKIYMKKNYNYLVAFVLLNFFCVNAYAQFQKINGNVKNGQSKENVSAASIVINGCALFITL